MHVEIITFFFSQVYRFSSKQSARVNLKVAGHVTTRSAFRCRDKWVNSICLWSFPEFPFDFVPVEQLFRFPPSFTSCAFSSSPRVRYNMIVKIICCCYRWLSCHQFLTLSTPSLVIVSWLNWEMRGSLAILVRLGVRSWWTSLILLQFYYWQKLKFLKYTNLSVVIGGQWIRFIALEIVVLFSLSLNQPNSLYLTRRHTWHDNVSRWNQWWMFSARFTQSW